MSEPKEYGVRWPVAGEGPALEAMAWIDKDTGRIDRVSITDRDGQTVGMTGDQFVRFYLSIAQPARFPLFQQAPDGPPELLIGTHRYYVVVESG